MSDNLDLSVSITTEEPEIAATLSDLRYLVFQGLKGDKGDKGDTGFSPEIRVTDIAGGHRLDIYNELGHETVDVMNGMDGEDGTDGTDGVSPTVTVTDIAGGHRVTITDATHPQGQSFAVMNGSGIPEDVKVALLNCFENVAWINDDGQTYYNALYAALYPPKTLVSISAVFTQGSAAIYDTDSLDTLKQYLTVTATYDDTSTGVVTNYTLSGTLTVGTSTITVLYGGKTATFNVTVSEYNPLPSTYTKYDYIESNGSAYTVIEKPNDPPVPLGYTVRTIAMQPTHASDYSKVASGGGSDNAYIAFAVYSKNNGRAGAYYSATNSLTSPYIDVSNLNSYKTEFVTKIESTGVTVTVTNNGITQTLTQPKVGSASILPAKYFRIATSGANGSTFIGKIYGIEILDTSDSLTYQFIPCKRNSDSKAGMYDVIGGTFYPSTSGTDFTAGND